MIIYNNIIPCIYISVLYNTHALCRIKSHNGRRLATAAIPLERYILSFLTIAQYQG
jgi:hypothetical protein